MSIWYNILGSVRVWLFFCFFAIFIRMEGQGHVFMGIFIF